MTLANGNPLWCKAKIESFTWWMQGKNYSASVYVLTLAGFDLILGLPWLTSLSTITWNFRSRTMTYFEQGQQFELQGVQETIITITGKELTQLIAVPDSEVVEL